MIWPTDNKMSAACASLEEKNSYSHNLHAFRWGILCTLFPYYIMYTTVGMFTFINTNHNRSHLVNKSQWLQKPKTYSI